MTASQRFTIDVLRQDIFDLKTTIAILVKHAGGVVTIPKQLVEEVFSNPLIILRGENVFGDVLFKVQTDSIGASGILINDQPLIEEDDL